MRRLALLLGAVGVAAAVGCSAAEPDLGVVAPHPGSKALESDDPSCKVDTDCAAGERCVEGLCQIQRCGTQEYRSAPPLGKRSYFAVHRELAVVSDDAAQRTIDGYAPTNGSFAPVTGKRFSIAGKRILDVVGGDFTGKRPESLAAIADASTKVYLMTGAEQKQLELGFQPVAIGAGDLDADGVQEVVVLGRDGDLSVCRVGADTCERRPTTGLTGKDITVADVDGDGFAEAIVLGDGADGKSAIVVVHLDPATRDRDDASTRLATGKNLARITAIELDGKQPVEVVALEDGGYADLVGDTLRFYAFQSNRLSERGTQSVANDAIDVFAGDVNGDDEPELLLLEKSGVEVFDPAGPSKVTAAYKTPLAASKGSARLAMADLDGDSPAASLVGEAELVPGPVVPVSVLVYPPYSRTYSEGTSQVFMGNRESASEVEATTVSLRASLALGFEAEIPAIAKVAVMGKVETQMSRTQAAGQAIVIGEKFTVDARPDLEGPDNGVAVIACACYHAYTYTIEDPAGRLGAAGASDRKMSVFVPVGGQASAWSLKRYNVLASRLGNLPVVQVPYVVGDPKSYPQTLQRLDGKPIAPADMLFTTPKNYRVSDAARVSWQLDMSQTQSTTERRSIGISVRGQLKAGFVTAEAEVGGSIGQEYTVAVGREASFGGTVPPIRNLAQTPEDEHAMHGYGFAPVVYRDRYTTKDGIDGGYWVVTYSVSR